MSSAAASSSSDCTGAGSSRLRSRKACSTRVLRCSCAGSGIEPPSWSGLSPVGSSSRARGLPPVSAINRSVTSGATPGRRSRSSRAAAGSSPRSWRSGMPWDGMVSRPRPGQRTPGARGRHRAGAHRTPVRRRWRSRASVRRRPRRPRCSPRRLSSAGTTSRRRPGTVRRTTRPPRRHDPKGAGLRTRKRVTQPRQREQQSVQGREGQWRFDLEPLRAQDGRLTRVRDQRVEQRRLAHTWFAVDDQAGRAAVPGLFEQLVEVRGSSSRPTSTK